MAERTSVALRVRDLSRVGLTVIARNATDMAETANTWLWRSQRDGENVNVERSLNAGVDWQSITVGESRFAAPTLAVDRWDNVWVWWHDLTTSYGYISYDYGESWQQIGQHLGGGPRMAIAPERSFLVMHDGLTTLTIYRTTDGGASISPVYAEPDVPAQLASLEIDRRGILHFVYKDADNALWHRWSDDPDAGIFSAATQWATGRFPGLALGTERGLFVWFSDGLLNLQVTDETFTELSGSAAVPSGAYTPGYTGVLLDRRGQAWLTPKPAGAAVKSIWSGDSLTGWSDP